MGRVPGDWVPSLDLSETTDALLVKMEVPGIDAKDVQISPGEPLDRQGGAEAGKEEEGENSAFTRSVRLPVGVDGSKVNATFKNGLLVVTLPKQPAATGSTMPVKPEWPT